MNLTIYRGTHEIGGNCVELVVGTSRLIIDVGLPLVTADREPFDASVLKGKTVVELLRDGVLPNVPGLFGEGDPPDAIILSHAHADHTGLLRYARREVPVYLSKGTSKMMLAGSIFANQPGVERGRCHVFKPEYPFRIGEFAVTAYPVDHSAFDSMAFVIEAEGKRVLYSGDLRLHGRKPGMAKRLIAATKRAPIDLMLMEGTHLSADRDPQPTEPELEGQIQRRIKDAKTLVLASFSPMHVDRLVTFYKATRRAGRNVVIDPYAAFVMHLIAGQCKIPRPLPAAGIRVYYNDHFEKTYQRRGLSKIHRLFTESRIDLEEVLSEPHRHVMLFRPSMLERDFGGQIPSQATCLYSYWTGYLDKPEWQSVQAALAAASGQFIEAHTSGHIFADDIKEFVHNVDPGVLIPVHTNQPGRFIGLWRRVQVLSDGQEAEIRSHPRSS